MDIYNWSQERHFRVVFTWVSKSSWFCIYYTTKLAQKRLASFFHPIRSKTKTIHVSPASHVLHVFTLSFDWLVELLWPLWLARKINYFVFGFTTCNWKLLSREVTVFALSPITLSWKALQLLKICRKQQIKYLIFYLFRNISDRLDGEQTNQRAEIMVGSSVNS